MLFDWFTVIAQIINFLILVFLLKRFLYGPVIRAMDAREKRIAERLNEASRRETEAEGARSEYDRKKEELGDRRQEMLDKARKEAEDARKELEKKAREEVDETRRRWRESVDKEKEDFLKNLRKQAGQQVYTIARKALSDLTGRRLEERMYEVFIGRLETFPEKQKSELADKLRGSEEKPILTSAFEMPQKERKRILEAVRENLPEINDLVFQTEPGILSGIELRVDGFVTGWNLRDYLEDLEREIRQMLESAPPRPPEPEGAEESKETEPPEKDISPKGKRK